jgi:glycosyltransferase involved in cell wall biosynthesis
MKISVVVPAFNEEKLIARSLGQIHSARSAFERLGWQSEVIVCDNNSTDRTAEMARAARATVVFEPVNQISRARNRGASVATGDWLVFVDADSYPTEELFGDVAVAIQTGKYLGGGATVRMEDQRGLVLWLTRAWNWLSRARRWMAGSFVFCEATAFRQLGGFSEELFAAEELDFSQRLKKLARTQRKRLVILHRHPLLTSGRKGELYSTWDFLRLLLRTAWRWGGNLKERADCHMWYDGRR